MNNELIKWPAPAKLNLMLRITGRRDDGYHLLQTVFQFVDLCDWITFDPLPDARVCLQQEIPGVAEQDDLTVKAAKMLQLETGCQQGVRIGVEKNLPMGGGIGGGSSDAATVLVVLNYLWNLHLSKERLMEIGVALGADVPIFVYGYSAWAEGVGERLQRLELPEDWFVIIKPDCHVVTKEVFSKEGLTRDSKAITIGDFLAGEIKNDCENVVLHLYPEVKQAWDALSVYAKPNLTGTGACIFSRFQERQDAEKVYEMLRSNWEVYLARGMSVSPLRKQLVKQEML